MQEAELSMKRRIGAPEKNILVAQSNIACTYGKLGRDEEALQLKRDVYSGNMKLHGEEHRSTIIAANNYACSLGKLRRDEEAKTLMHKTVSVARRVLGDNDGLTSQMRKTYARALLLDEGATLDDFREAVETLESVAPLWKRVFGQSHPETPQVYGALNQARAALREAGGA